MITRHRFDIDCDTGGNAVSGNPTSYVDSGAPFNGEIVMAVWNPSVHDTGADMQVDLRIADDTGAVIRIMTEKDTLDGSFTRMPVLPQTDVLGLDTGVDAYAAAVSAGGHFRVSVQPGTDRCKGRLWIWTRKHS
jgi:hypothetical protein